MPVNILVVAHEPIEGCAYHRLLVPFEHLGRAYASDYHISRINTLDWEQTDKTFPCGEGVSRKEWLSQFDLVIFGRQLSFFHKNKEVAYDCHAAGCQILFDMDDYFDVSPNHIMFRDYQKNDVAEKVIECIRVSDYVMTTTEYLAGSLRKHNPNVIIFPNAVDPESFHPKTRLMQWRRIKSEFPVTRFGWVGSVCHREDLAVMEDGIRRIWCDNRLKGRFQMVLGGFALGQYYMGEVMKNGEKVTEKIPYPAEHQTQVYFERVFTDNYHCFIDQPKYKEWLQRYERPGLADVVNKNYRRIWAEDTFTYGTFYNYWDVTLIPLNNNHFNRCKSQLKVIESGFMGKAVICSEVIPYVNDIQNGVNGLLVPHGNKKAWYKAIRSMILDADMRKELAENLQKYIVPKYHISIVNKKRHEFIQKIAGQKAESERLAATA